MAISATTQRRENTQTSLKKYSTRVCHEGSTVYAHEWEISNEKYPNKNIRKANFFRAFFGSIPEDFGNRGESTITKLPMRTKQMAKAPRPNHAESSKFFFQEIGSAVWPREFYHFLSKENSRGKIPVAISLFLLRKKRNRHSICRGLVFLMVLLPLFIPHW